MRNATLQQISTIDGIFKSVGACNNITFLVYVLKWSVILTSLNYKPHCKMG